MLKIEKISGRAAFNALIAVEGLNWTLSNYPWGSAPMDVRARVCHDGENLYVSMRCYERAPRATVTEHEGAVHLDSCMEFFFSPCPELREHYFNMEANPNGAMKFNYGAGRHGRIKTDRLPESAGMRAEKTDAYWQLTYQIPYALIRAFATEFTGAPGSRIRGNMYRCGELAEEKSFVTLLPIAVEKPDYHRPEFFGWMELA
ncbi:MAG: carbohydrate-binding family 9-like protein [Clostridiaceae bacterium]|nr:carbohydrate-binding family 9-like protein [Clostridiaceae bacterium]